MIIKLILFLLFHSLTFSLPYQMDWRRYESPIQQYLIKVQSNIDKFVIHQSNLYAMKDGSLIRISFNAEGIAPKITFISKVSNDLTLIVADDSEVVFEDGLGELHVLNIASKESKRTSYRSFWNKIIFNENRVSLTRITENLSSKIKRSLANYEPFYVYNEQDDVYQSFWKIGKIIDLKYYPKEKKFYCKFYLNNTDQHCIVHFRLTTDNKLSFSIPFSSKLDFGFVPYISYSKVHYAKLLNFILSTESKVHITKWGQGLMTKLSLTSSGNSINVAHLDSKISHNNTLQGMRTEHVDHYFMMKDRKLYWSNIYHGFTDIALQDKRPRYMLKEKGSIHPMNQIVNQLSLKENDVENLIDELTENLFIYPKIYLKDLAKFLFKRYQFIELEKYQDINIEWRTSSLSPDSIQALQALHKKDYTKTVRILEKSIKEEYKKKTYKSKSKKKNKEIDEIKLVEWIQVAVFDALGEYDRVTKFAIHMQKRLKKDWERDIHLADTVRYLIEKNRLELAKKFMSKFFKKNSYRAMAYNCMGLISAKEEKWTEAKAYFDKTTKLNSSLELLFDMNQINQKVKISPKVLIAPKEKVVSKPCYSCKAQLQKNTKFCGECGTKVRPSNCVNCKHRLTDKNKFCPNCGQKI